VIAVSYHESTKHHFNRFARSRGYLDWATQPYPFRRYEGAPTHELSRRPLVPSVSYDALFTTAVPPQRITQHSIGEFLRCSMGLSAWKQHGSSRWALRVNPSSGNLHPTEAWIVHDGRVCHYAPKEHALEERCAFAKADLKVGLFDHGCFLVALTSIVWREAWKYGERAFRYCQHDTGHAIGALRLAAAMLGWRMQLLPQWSDAQIVAMLGLDREMDFGNAEREEPQCVAVVGGDARFAPDAIVAAAQAGSWFGQANLLSPDHVKWPIIDEVAAATRYPGTRREEPRTTASPVPDRRSPLPDLASRRYARDIILQRRSALAFDPRGALERDALFSMLARLHPGSPPSDAIDWPTQVHLVLFIHRVRDVTPGIYAYVRDPAVVDEWKRAMRAEFLWEPVHPRTPEPRPAEPPALFLLVPIEAGAIANRLSCDQDIAEDGFFAVAMIARFGAALREHGEWFYRRLFWECGLIGQVFYLEAEAVGGRATGIGCYYDDPVHELLGLSGQDWQSLYHFSMGVPLEDARLTSEPGYPWEELQAR
jgi:SagB-type dehydrogenase family enzyme